MSRTDVAIRVAAGEIPRGGSMLLSPLVLGISTAVLFMALASIRLTAQGVEQDELHQAAGVFAWRGQPILNYAELRVGGYPVLNMSYSGAIKTAFYGLYLRYSGRGFSVLTWRALGILIGGFAILTFFLLAGRRLPPMARAVFALLLLCDPSLLLLQRHDYGPVAIAFFLRMLFLAVWLRQADSQVGVSRSCFWLGVIAGVAAFEKLSSLVLLLPFLLAVLSPLGRASARRFATAGLGVLLGFLPLIATNLYSLRLSGSLISLSAVERVDHSFGSLVHHGGALLSLGSGARAREFLLGDRPPLLSEWLEGITLGALLVLSIATLVRGSREPVRRFAVLCGLSYLLVGLGTWLLPAAIDAHHRVLATPFQYLAIAVAAASVFPMRHRPSGLLAAGILLAGVFVANRAVTLASTVNALFERRASLAYDPSFTRLGEFARRSSAESAFIAADWGVAIPMFCLSDGATGRVFDIYWFYRGPADLDRVLLQPSKEVFYSVTRRPPSSVRESETQRLLGDLSNSPSLEEVAPEPEIANLAAVSVRKFVRRRREGVR